MKKLRVLYQMTGKFLLGLGLTSMWLVACTPNGADIQPLPEVDEQSVETEAVIDADFEEIDDLAANAMVLADVGVGGRVTDVQEMDDERMRCATVTHDMANGIIVIDFGDGCTGPNGVTRSGKIIIQYDGRRFVPGSFWSITFDNFYINDRHIEGIRKVTNVSESIDADPTFNIVLLEGKVTWPDSTFATREVNRTRVWHRASNPLQDEWWILEGSTANGTTRDGISYSTNVLEKLVFKRTCRGPKKGRVPVSGVKEIQYGDRELVVDFGDGECDTIVTVTTNGETYEIDLSDR
ncbi:MAG TPA: hypothetical protein ENJ39_06640 [Flammeovirgaceae bacterium]|nr:hypothetical protein [Flammeovirgaceae bacterium]